MTSATEVARALISAQDERRALASPFTDSMPELTAPVAYEIQQAVVNARLGPETQMVGAKLGLTSRAKQRQMSVEQPLYGWLTSDMALRAGEPLDLDALIHPRAEPEIAFVLGDVPVAPATVSSVLAATESVCAAIEIIDSRYDNFRFRLPDVIADNASSAAFVLGGVAIDPAHAGDLRLIGCVLSVDGEVVATAAGAAVLGHPAAAVAWLVNRLAERGRALPAGSIVLSGALTDAVAVGAGTRVTAEFGDLGMVEVQA